MIPRITQVTAFKSESTSEIYESHRDAAVCEAAEALRDLLVDGGLQCDSELSAIEIAEMMSANVAEFRKILKLF
jgi:hypothetical protein